MSRGFGTSASGKSCTCEIKDKSNWTIIGYSGRKKTVSCSKCRSQWDTTAKYTEHLQKASYLK